MLEVPLDSYEALKVEPEISECAVRAKKGKEHKVEFGADMYDSVAVAAFGGVRMGHGSEAETQSVHAFWMFIPCVILWITQFSLIAILSLDFNLTQSVSTSDNTSIQLLTLMKMLLVCMIQLQPFSKILECCRLTFFIMNPITWMELVRPDPSTMISPFAFTFKAGCVYIFPILALVLKLVIVYVVCVTSLSIILGSDDAVAVIFNSLAITWIIDLDAVFFKVYSTITMLDKERYESFKFTDVPDDHPWRQIDIQNTCCKRLRNFVSYKKNTVAAKAARAFTYFFMLFLYFRQLMILHYALETDILPVARDVCTAWRWLDGPNKGITELEDEEVKGLRFIPAFRTLQMELARIADPKRHNSTGYCTHKYDRMHIDDQVRMLHEHGDLLIWILGIMLVFFFPQIIVLCNTYVRGLGDPDAIEEQEGEP